MRGAGVWGLPVCLLGAQLGGVKSMQMQLFWILGEGIWGQGFFVSASPPLFAAYLSNVTPAHVLTTPAEFQTGSPKRISLCSARLLVGGARDVNSVRLSTPSLHEFYSTIPFSRVTRCITLFTQPMGRAGM